MGIQKQRQSNDNSPGNINTIYLKPGEILCRIPVVCPVCGFTSEEFNDTCNNQATTKYIEDDPKRTRRAIMTASKNPGTKKYHPERVVNPLSQTNEENSGGQKSQWNNRVSVKKRCSINNKYHRPYNRKSLVPVVNYHIFKRIYWLLRHNLFIRKA